jgi:putative transposase
MSAWGASSTTHSWPYEERSGDFRILNAETGRMTSSAVSGGMRRPRFLIEGAEYHVTARANRQEFILQSKEVKELLLRVLREAKTRFAFRVRTFCIMSNHVHLMIQPEGGECLSAIMQWILGVFAIRYNRMLGQLGHVWYDRFRSSVVKSVRQIIHVFAYIAANPVKAGMVADPFEYRHCGVRNIRDGDFSIVEPPDELISAALLEFPRSLSGVEIV